jgi:hypothetical protein
MDWLFAFVSVGVLLQCAQFLRHRKERRFALFLKEFDREAQPAWSRFWIIWHIGAAFIALMLLLKSVVGILQI